MLAAHVRAMTVFLRAWHDVVTEPCPLSSAEISHSSRIRLLALVNGKKSRIFRPSNICAGERLMPVVVYCDTASGPVQICQCREIPEVPRCHGSARFAVLTATSALQLE